MNTAEPLSTADELRTFAARITRDPDQPFGVTGVALRIHRWDGPTTSHYAGTDRHGSPIHEDSVFCLASVGKLAIALLVLDLVDSGRLTLDTSIGEHLPVRATPVGTVRVGQLLSHRSGVPPVLLESHVAYTTELTRDALRSACRQVALVANQRVVYSDIGYGLLGDLLEQLWGEPLDSIMVARLNARLGTSLRLTPPQGTPVVAVEQVNNSGESNAIAPMNSPFWRALALPWGGVHGTIRDMVVLAHEFSEMGSLLSPSLRAIATADPDHGLLSGGIEECGAHLGIAGASAVQWSPCPWGLGPELRGEKTPHWTPREASAQSFGHVGTSGTLVWCDPVARVTWAMAGTRCSASGWLFRHGPTLGRIALRG